MSTLDIIHKTALDNILLLMNNAKLSDIAFCEAMHLKDKTVDNWKRGNSTTFMKMLDEIADFFNVSVYYILGFEQKNKPATKSDELSEEQTRIIELLQLVPEEDQKMLVAMIEGALRSRGLLK